MSKDSETADSKPYAAVTARLEGYLILVLQASMMIGLLLAIITRHWQDVLTITGIILFMHLPWFLSRRSRIYVPPEVHLVTILFLFASLFLGEIHGYYTRFWWWDIALHATSGLLLGIFGFLLVYVLNEDDKIEIRLRPRFVAIFAFAFAVAIGALWEMLEFAIDELAGLDMQKAMGDDPSGLTDTMWDLIVDAAGAAIVALTGWWHMKMQRRSIFDNWIQRFVEANPHLFT